jgi:hypothetical protein
LQITHQHCCGLRLQVASKEQRDIEQQLAVITEKLKMQHFCQSLQFHNVLTYKQIAEVYVNAWPFVPDALSGGCRLSSCAAAMLCYFIVLTPVAVHCVALQGCHSRSSPCAHPTTRRKLKKHSSAENYKLLSRHGTAMSDAHMLLPCFLAVCEALDDLSW